MGRGDPCRNRNTLSTGKEARWERDTKKTRIVKYAIGGEEWREEGSGVTVRTRSGEHRETRRKCTDGPVTVGGEETGEGS